MFVQLLTARHGLLEPLQVEGQDGGRAEDQQLLAGGRVDGGLLPGADTRVGVVLLLVVSTGLAGPLQQHRLEQNIRYVDVSHIK